MDVSAPYRSLAPTLDLDVLVVLADTTQPLTARALRQRARRGSDRGIRLALARLAEQGLVDTQPAGSATLYALNADHLAAPLVRILADLQTEFLTRIRTTIEAWSVQPRHASLFGSAARRDGDATSDIDLLLVRPHRLDEDAEPWREQVDELTAAITRWTGNRVGLSELDTEDIERLRTERPAIVEELQHDATDLMGVPMRTLLRAA